MSAARRELIHASVWLALSHRDTAYRCERLALAPSQTRLRPKRGSGRAFGTCAGPRARRLGARDEPRARRFELAPSSVSARARRAAPTRLLDVLPPLQKYDYFYNSCCFKITLSLSEAVHRNYRKHLGPLRYKFMRRSLLIKTNKRRRQKHRKHHVNELTYCLNLL